jgi:hypothetical protein
VVEPIYDRSGRCVGWLRQGRVLDRSNQWRAIIRDDSVHTFGGVYVGRFRDGWFLAQDGSRVGFIPGATGGPAQPAPMAAPVAPTPLAPPIPSAPVAPPAPPAALLGWSTQSFDEYLGESPRAGVI